MDLIKYINDLPPHIRKDILLNIDLDQYQKLIDIDPLTSDIYRFRVKQLIRGKEGLIRYSRKY